ncbi:hypothetical protein FRX31_004828 [Thalictrum thalictroides]|uniref:Uncharacterized protein n=1 Tax=Thalictrum thalictroides TaxID=46969 RepID=A0A7J6X7A8_THATH|nr:hypothetical protein FRX31_004828 [Thalictrum thalictroides]
MHRIGSSRSCWGTIVPEYSEPPFDHVYIIYETEQEEAHEIMEIPESFYFEIDRMDDKLRANEGLDWKKLFITYLVHRLLPEITSSHPR